MADPTPGRVQLRRGALTKILAFLGLEGELTYSRDETTVRVHDGTKDGGYALAHKHLEDTVVPGDHYHLKVVNGDLVMEESTDV